MITKEEKERIAQLYYNKGYKNFEKGICDIFNADQMKDEVFYRYCEKLNENFKEHSAYQFYFKCMFSKGWSHASRDNFEKDMELTIGIRKRTVRPVKNPKNKIKTISVEDYLKEKSNE